MALDAVPSRRRVLQLGAVGVPLVLTPKTGLAQTMASVNCSVVLNPGDQNFGLVPTDADYLQNPQILPEMTLTPEQLNTGSFVSDVSDPQYNGAYLRFLSAMVDGTEPLPTASCLTSVLHVQTRQF
ncbi:MAG: hypothetical protein D6782_00305 [Alphaproteobacteria bacterium]|nr:MAG: hypothetical protein D6782_00305 [Alphaproteobacteria bacterium]